MLNIYCKMRMEQLKKEEEFTYSKYYPAAIKNMDSVDCSNNDIPKCRICLQKAFIYIFDNDKTDIIEALQIIGNINLNENDEFPKHLCKICFKFIKEALLFRNTAIKADNILRQPKPTKIEESYNDADFNWNDDQDGDDYYNTNNNDINKTYKPRKRLTTPERKIRNARQLEWLKQSNYKPKKFPCPICNKLYLKVYLKKHITIHEEIKPLNHVCDICGNGYRLKSSYAHHIAVCKKGFSYKCESCPYTGKDMKSLKAHARIHLKDLNVDCDWNDNKNRDCDDFYNPNNDNKEMDTPRKRLRTPQRKKEIANKEEKTKRKGKQVPCPICNKLYHKAYLTEHITIHEETKPLKHVCDICGKGYRLRTTLVRHLAQHTKGFPFKCESCPYRAKDLATVKRHSIIHAVDYKYKCTQCPAKYKAKPNLNRHLLNHKERQFKCDKCPKAYYTNGDLRIHNESVHLGIKRHICNVCGKAFGRRQLLLHHSKKMHKRENIYKRLPKYLLEAENEGT